jgi:hypothetical protein
MDREWPSSFRKRATKVLEEHGLIKGLDFWWDDGLRVPGPASAELVGLLLREFCDTGPARWNEEEGRNLRWKAVALGRRRRLQNLATPKVFQKEVVMPRLPPPLKKYGMH